MTDDLVPHMSADDVEVLVKYLSNSTHYFEYGCGGSTKLASESASIQKIWSVESDPIWIEKIKHLPKVIAMHIDVGETGSWGIPRFSDKCHAYPSSILQVSETPDLVVIDGIMRIACGIRVWQKLNAANAHSTKVLIHDWPRHYHVLDALYDITVVSSHFAELKAKKVSETFCIDDMYRVYMDNMW